MTIQNFALYKELIRLEFLKMLAYRSTYYTGIINYTIQTGAYYFLWDAIYQNQGRLGGLNRDQMITYLIIAWVARAFYFNTMGPADIY